MRNPEKDEGIPNTKSVLGNEELPEGAKKFVDEKTARRLQEMWDKEVDFYQATQININGGLDLGSKNIPGLEKFEVEISGPGSKTFKSKLHPGVEGVEWFRGMAIKAHDDNPNNLVLIFTGWMQPWIQKPLPPIVYTVGDIPDQTVRMVIYGHTTGISSYVDMLRQNPNQDNE